MHKIHLLVIDPQVDFCDPNGSLYVKGAEKDMDRLAQFVRRVGGKLDDFHVTLDSHHVFDVAHPSYWRDSSGKNPSPFTTITVESVKRGDWQPSIPSMFERSLKYLEALESAKRYQCMIWPEHCLIGSEGHNVHPLFRAALFEWERAQAGNLVNKVTKGSNPFSEHYSAVKAEVPDPTDPTTQLNTNLIRTLMDADEVVIAGEALSHCVANTVRDIADAFGDDRVKNITLLTDASSNVAGLESLGETFVREMTSRGMKFSTTVDYLR